MHFIPFNNRKLPKFLEVKNKDYISYGEKNDYPYYLIDLYKRSSYNCAIINGKVKYISGAGWTYDKYGVTTVGQRAIAEKILKQPLSETDLNETTRRVTFDFELFNGYAILVKWAKNKRTCNLEHIDFANIRTNADRSEFYFTRGWYITKNGQVRENKKPEDQPDWKVYKAYDPKDRTGNQIFYYSAFHPDQYVYPLPSYVGGVTWIESHIAYGDFQYTNIKKSFAPAKIINVYGTVPPVEMQTEIADNIKKNFTGEEGERIVVGFHASKELGIEAVDSLVNDQSVLYREIADQSLQNIFTAHEITSPMLFGIRTEGQLGGRSEMMDSFEILQSTYVDGRQACIEYGFNTILSDVGIGIKFKLNKNSPISSGDLLDPAKQKILNALNVLSPLVANKVLESMSSEEIRGLIGLKGEFVNTTQSKFNADKPVSLEIFNGFGVSADLYEEIEGRDIPTTDPIELEKFEKDYLSMSFADVKVRSIDRTVLDLLNKDGFMPVENIAKAAKVSPSEVKDAIERLSERGYINPSKETVADEKVRVYEVSKEGKSTLDEAPAKTEAYQVMYRYDLAAGMPKAVSGSRPFCSELMAKNMLFTRDEINTMSDREDRNVWTLRGGWYHNPNTGVNQPQCRHTWRQVIVKRKQ